jgi:anionic cell wall polymer biosynthesis LytR-Cps2A-Psr (LCP) family protein
LFACTAQGQAAAPAVSGDPAAASSGVEEKKNLSYSNKWRIEVSEGANSDGIIYFHVTPKGGSTTVVKIEIDDGTSENHVARVIKRAFEKQLDTSKYDIEMDDGEDVLVKKDLTEPVFALELISSTVKSVRLDVEKE